MDGVEKGVGEEEGWESGYEAREVLKVETMVEGFEVHGLEPVLYALGELAVGKGLGSEIYFIVSVHVLKIMFSIIGNKDNAI